MYLVYLHVTSEKHFSNRDRSNVLFSCHPSRSSAHIKHILVCTAIDVRTAPGDHLSDCIGFASWKERKALFARGNNAIKSERGQQLWRQNWNNNFFLKAKRFFSSKLISICVLSILTYDRPLLGAANTLRPKWKATALQCCQRWESWILTVVLQLF